MKTYKELTIPKFAKLHNFTARHIYQLAESGRLDKARKTITGKLKKARWLISEDATWTLKRKGANDHIKRDKKGRYIKTKTR